MSAYPTVNTSNDIGALDSKRLDALVAYAKTPGGMIAFGGGALVGSMIGGKKHRVLGAILGIAAVPLAGAALGFAAHAVASK